MSFSSAWWSRAHENSGRGLESGPCQPEIFTFVRPRTGHKLPCAVIQFPVHLSLPGVPGIVNLAASAGEGKNPRGWRAFQHPPPGRILPEGGGRSPLPSTLLCPGTPRYHCLRLPFSELLLIRWAEGAALLCKFGTACVQKALAHRGSWSWGVFVLNSWP